MVFENKPIDWGWGSFWHMGRFFFKGPRIRLVDRILHVGHLVIVMGLGRSKYRGGL